MPAETIAEMPEEVTESVNEIDEEKGFNAAIDALLPDEPSHPLGGSVEVSGNELSEGEAEAQAEEIVEQAEKFLGDMTADEVLERISKIEGLEDQVYEKVSQKVFGKFGEIGQKLKALEERELRFDPEKLNKLRELDESVADALAEDLKEALTGQSVDMDSLRTSVKQELMQEVNPYMEQRLLAALVSDADEIVKTDEFANWFFKDAKQEVRDLFQAWDDRTMMDGVAMASAFNQYKAFQNARTQEKKAKDETLAKSVEDKRGSSKTPAPRRTMSEDEAFAARTKETAR